MKIIEIIEKIIEKIKKWWLRNHKKSITKKQKITNKNSKEITKNKKIVIPLSISNDDSHKSILRQDIRLNEKMKIEKDIINDDTISLNENEKITIIKENITNLISERLTNYEENLIDKAYHEYSKINYIILTTLKIDDLFSELKKMDEDIQNNKHNKYHYQQKVQEITYKLQEIERLTNKKEVIEEIKILKNDLYTKKKDKYDLLYNKEVFIDITKRCQEILNRVEEKSLSSEKNTKISQEKIETERTNKQTKVIKNKQNEILIEKKEYEEKIIKRFFDNEVANNILKKRELLRQYDKKHLITNTIHFYNEFIVGESHKFYFDRNKVKTEVVKLYNDITSNLCLIYHKDFIPLEHINIQLDQLIMQTMDNQVLLNTTIYKETGFKMHEANPVILVNKKLNNLMEKEKQYQIIKHGKDKKKQIKYKESA